MSWERWLWWWHSGDEGGGAVGVPDFLVVLILVFEGDQVRNFGFGEVVVVPENVDGTPDFVLSLIPKC